MEKSTHSKEYELLRAALRQAREDAGLSQRGLAVRLKLPHSWVAKVESGERRLDVVELCWYVTACNLRPTDFFDRLVDQFQGGRSRPRSGGGKGK
jgi:transcriptional regulator with XRE-family HTH domain